MKISTYFTFLQILLLNLFLSSCSHPTAKINDVPDLRFVSTSENCHEIVYSSNINNIYRPWVIKDIYGEHPHNYPLKLAENMELFPMSISCDCKTISMYDFDKDQQQRKSIYFYDEETQKLTNVNDKFKIKITESSFSPTDFNFAYLDEDSKLRILNYKTGDSLSIVNPDTVKFHYITWSTNAHYIYLEDNNSSIWKFDIAGKTFKLIWKTPSVSDYSKELTLSLDDEDVFYFRSDHQSDFTQLYKYDPINGAKLLFTSNSIKSLYVPVKNDSLYFKAFLNDLLVLQLFSKGKVTNVFPQQGVLFDYHPGKKPIMIYADHQHPYSVYRVNGTKLSSIIKGMNDAMPEPVVIKNSYKMDNLVYFPLTKAKKWIVILHGGPHQEVFRKYDRFNAYLLKAGFGLIILNYPGSIGTGKTYEMRHTNDLSNVELKSIEQDLNQIKDQYPDIKKFAMMGVSYSSVLAHIYSKTHDDISELIDLSGYGNIPGNEKIPILYIYGKNDFALDDPKRLKMMRNDSLNGNGVIVTVKDEGHVIARRNNTRFVLDKMADFLNEH